MLYYLHSSFVIKLGMRCGKKNHRLGILKYMFIWPKYSMNQQQIGLNWCRIQDSTIYNIQNEIYSERPISVLFFCSRKRSMTKRK